MKHYRLPLAVSALAFLAAACADRPSPSAPQIQSVSAVQDLSQGAEVLSQAVIHRTIEGVAAERRAARAGGAASTTSNMYYHGGTGGFGVETAPKIYLVVWGSQWSKGDPSGEVAILQHFYSGIGGSGWMNSVTQYCQGIANGASNCGVAGAVAAGNPAGIYAGVWYDNAKAAPTHPRQSDLAKEAVAAAAHFGNTTAASNASVQYVIATATGNSSSGFKTQYCAYHSSTSTSYGNVAYTNLPYITDAGASCGANFNGLGALAGITMVSGHEAGETMTDQFPSTGWLDSSGAENGDKCAWIATGSVGASANVTFSTGTFAVQSLWSNASSSCVLSYP